MQRLTPDELEYVPAAQLSQPVWLMLDWNVPTLHAVHALAPLEEYVPITQFWQVLDEVAPVAAEDVPEGQLKQDDEPLFGW